MIRELIKKARECEGCKRRRAKLTKFARKVDRAARDLLRQRRRK